MPPDPSGHPDTLASQAPVPDPKRNRYSNPGGGVFSILLPFVYGMLGALVAIVAFTYLAPQRQHVATVDVLKIMDSYDTETIDAIKSGDSDAARRASEKRAKRGAELETLLEQLARERGLLLVQKQAIVGGDVHDLTNEVLMMMEKM